MDEDRMNSGVFRLDRDFYRKVVGEGVALRRLESQEVEGLKPHLVCPILPRAPYFNALHFNSPHFPHFDIVSEIHS